MYVWVCARHSQYCRDTLFTPALPVGVGERLACLEGKVCHLEGEVNDLKREQALLSQTVAIVETQSSGMYRSSDSGTVVADSHQPLNLHWCYDRLAAVIAVSSVYECVLCFH